jgi:hypothetical protein
MPEPGARAFSRLADRFLREGRLARPERGAQETTSALAQAENRPRLKSNGSEPPGLFGCERRTLDGLSFPTCGSIEGYDESDRSRPRSPFA